MSETQGSVAQDGGQGQAGGLDQAAIEFEKQLIATMTGQQNGQSQDQQGSQQPAGTAQAAPAQTTTEGGDAGKGAASGEAAPTGTPVEQAFDKIAKPWETGSGQQAADSTPKDVSAVQAELDKIKAILERPSVKSILAAEAEGRSIFDVVANELKTPDTSKMSDEDVFKLDLADLNLSEEELRQEMDNWNSKSPAEKKREVKALRAKFDTQRTQELTKYADSALSSTANNRAQERDIVTKSAEAFETKVDSMKGQKLFGVLEIDDATSKTMKEALSKEDLLPKKADGTYDDTALMEMVAFRKFKDLIFTNIARTAFKSAYDVFVKENSVENHPVQTGGAGAGAPLTLEAQIRRDIELNQASMT